MEIRAKCTSVCEVSVRTGREKVGSTQFYPPLSVLALLRSERAPSHPRLVLRWSTLRSVYIFVNVSMNRLAISPTSAGPTAELEPRP